MTYTFVSTRGERLYINKLSASFCKENGDELIKLINIIPHITWTYEDLISQDQDFYGNKWNYSYVITNSKNRIIGVLIAYFRKADEKHIFDSIYIHRFAITPDYQNIGIGTFVLNYFIKKTFLDIPWLLNISLQTNDCVENKYVMDFYIKNKFNPVYNVYYPDKKDILMLLERKNFRLDDFYIINHDIFRLRHPRLKILDEKNEDGYILPIIYFSSTNEKKKEIVSFIFNNYNIEVRFVSLPVELTEPQIERPELEEERKLVSLPLKAASRFINNVPCVIEDTMLFVEFFNRNGNKWELPGLDTKRWLRQIGLDGFLDIMGSTDKRKARFVSQTGAFIRANKYTYGRGEIEGIIAYQRSNVLEHKYGTYPYFFHQLFIPDGADKTLAEMDMYEYAKYDYMRKSIVELIDELSMELYYRQQSIFDFL